MTHARDNFLAWLRAAHAMEEQAITTMTAQSRRIESYPDLKERVDLHLAETMEHAQILREMLEQFAGAGRVLVLRDMAARLAAKAQGVGGMLTNDEVVKSAVNAYAFAHLQIGQYRVLMAAADELEQLQAQATFRRILDQKIAMADWLEANLDVVTRVFLMRDERDLMAKR